MIQLLLSALAILSLHAVCWDGNAFDRVNRWTWRWPSWLKKPLFDCLFCMSSIWSVPTYVLFYDSWSTVGYLRHVFPLAGILFLLDFILNTINPMLRYGGKERP